MKTCELLTACFFIKNEFRILVDLLTNHNKTFFLLTVILVETIRLVIHGILENSEFVYRENAGT